MKPLRTLLLAGLVAAVAATIAPLTTSVAEAAVPGLQTVSFQSPVGTAQQRTVTVGCPAGTSLLSPSGQINAGVSGRYVLTAVVPVDDTTARVSAALRAGAAPAPWSLTARATCAPALPGLVTVSAVSATDSDPVKYAQAACPGRKQAVGVGAVVHAPAGQVGISEMAPTGTAGSIAAATEADQVAAPGTWNVVTFLRCADWQYGLTAVSATGARSTGTSHQQTVSCPAQTVAVTGGALISLQDTAANPHGMFVDETVPLGSTFSAVGASGASHGPWNVITTAVCARPRPLTL
jgi:hypothetical protein